MLKRTPLFVRHTELGGKMVSFGGFEMPVQYPSGIVAEHNAVRNACGIFDVSHMGELILKGETALATVQKLLTNDMSGMAVGRCRYSPMCNEQGGVVDDLLVYKLSEDSYMLIVNAGNYDKDLAWVRSHLLEGTSLEDISAQTGLLALQGPKSKEILLKLLPEESIPKKYYSFFADIDLLGSKCLISRTGYTGELGYEIYCPEQDTVKLFNALLENGKESGLIPCGLGARDTLRLEAGMPLYGNEMSEEITPFEADLGFFVKLEKQEDFIGKAALIEKQDSKRVRCGLEVTERGIVREHAELFSDDVHVGTVTSGTMSPYSKKAIAMALLDKKYAELGTVLTAEQRGRKMSVKVVELPFYKRNK
ncbi:MAG: glycine cleavage system aminomethyltransferase GcvT [Eubacteriales bacterium]|nr:glycine cleavage system aminomethyltransferase GcvT [Eubacteriales bacterium]